MRSVCCVKDWQMCWSEDTWWVHLQETKHSVGPVVPLPNVQVTLPELLHNKQLCIIATLFKTKIYVLVQFDIKRWLVLSKEQKFNDK